MLKEITISNYKCFKNNVIQFKSKNNIIIGENNAGKSTLLEVIRIINFAINKLNSRGYSIPDNEYELGISLRGVSFNLNELEIETENLFFQYEEKEIVIKAKFSNNVTINIYILSPIKVFAFGDFNGNNIKHNDKFREVFMDEIAILPQITLLKKEEKRIHDDRTLKDINKRLTSLHFRNELLVYREKYNELYNKYIESIQETWSGIAFEEIYVEGDIIYIIIRENDFSIEVGKLGSGVQMWLQMLWFFIKNLDASTIILDEPDVYLHPELQKKIIKIAKNYNKQLIVATHSIEIISEVNRDEIIILNKNKEKTRFVSDIKEIQEVLDKIGSSQILSLVKFEKYNKMICVEGEDIEILSIWHEILYKESDNSLKDITNYRTGGWGSWDFEKTRAKKIVEENEMYKIYYIYDSDYHTDDTIEKRLKEAKDLNINLHIWSKKEIENYLIDLNVLYRVINTDEEKITYENLKNIIDNICEELKQDMILKCVDEISKKEKGKAPSTIMKEVEKNVNEKWVDFNYKISCISGKEIMKKLISQLQTDYKIHLSKNKIARGFKKKEINPEVVEVIKAIEENRDWKEKQLIR